MSEKVFIYTRMAAKITVPDNGPDEGKVPSVFRQMIGHGVYGDRDDNAEAG